MCKSAIVPSRRILTLLAFVSGFAMPFAAVAGPRVSLSYGKLPLHFEANQGQTHEKVRFLARGSGYSLYLTHGEAVFLLAKPNPDKKREWHGKRDWRSKPERPKAQEVLVLRMAIVDAHPAPLVSGLDELPGKANYFIGDDPAKWRTNIPIYVKVHYREVYPGIDLLYYGNQRQLEYDFVVAPGADPKRIVLGYKGADKLEIDAEGDLVLHVAERAIRQHKPVIYQEVKGIRRQIAGSYILKGANRVGFQVAAYDRSRPLVIDPILSYSTYLGGSDSEYGSAIAVDRDGNAYVTGQTASLDFPTTSGAFQPTGGAGDAFVIKLDPAGSALVYSTYLGGSGGDGGFAIAVDAAGNAYVTGATFSSNFPTTLGACPTESSDASSMADVFVTKLDPAGSALAYSTCFGGSSYEAGSGIAVDTDGSAYVTGHTYSANFPTTLGAFQPIFGGGPTDPYSGFPPADAFVTKLNPTGSGFVYSTYLGGISHDSGEGIAVDAAGNAYLTGYTLSTNFPTTAEAFQPSNGGPDRFGNPPFDAFVTKLNSTGSALVYSTYLGGSDQDLGRGIALDADGNAYVTGYTYTNFPTTPGAFQPLPGSPGPATWEYLPDAFVTKLNSIGSALVYSTYLGGNGVDDGYGIAVDTAGNAYVTGQTSSTNFPTTAAALDGSYNGGEDAFVTKLNPTGSGLVYSTYLGGGTSSVQYFGAGDAGYGIAVDAAGSAYVTGVTASLDFPTTPGAFQTTHGGSFNDVFVAKITDPPETTTSSTPFSGTPIAIPGSFEAEDFDLGGEGVAYHDNVPGNAGGQYRPNEDVDIIVSSDSAGGGYVVNNFETGEWLAYTVNVAASGNYDVELRVATRFDFPNSAYHLEVDGVNVTGTVVLPTTNNDPNSGWNNFQWLGKKTVFLGAGQHVLKIVADQQYFNLNSVRIAATPTPAPVTSTSFTGTPIPVPGTFEAEDFDLGGEGVAYHDNVPGNAGGQYRPNEDVDIIVSSDSAGGGYVVNNFETGEWLIYTIDVQTAGLHDIELRASNGNWSPPPRFHVEIDGVDATGSITVPSTGSWSTFQWVGKKGVSLTAGRHLLKIVADQQYFNLNSIRLLPPSTTTRFEESAPTYTGYWPSYGSETGNFSGGIIVASNQATANATFSFAGTAITWLGVKCNVCGVATVSIDGGAPTMVNTAGPASSNLTSEPVFSASGLAPGVNHTMAITATGMTASGGTYIAVDAFDVTR